MCEILVIDISYNDRLTTARRYMKNLGILILLIGLGLGGYSLLMDVSVAVPSRDFGYGLSTPAMQVANVGKMAQRQNFMIFSGILSVVGAILIGFGSLRSNQVPASTPEILPDKSSPEEDREWLDALIAAPQAFSICPKCRHLGDENDAACGRCGVKFAD